MSFLLHEEQEHCSDTMCVMLPIGYALMAMDACYDLQWSIFPSPKTALALRSYYINLLTPQILTPFPWPGYWFPVYAAFVFLWQCPNIYNWYIFLLYIPLSYRYFGILSGKDKSLSHWWTVLLLRVALTIVTHNNLASRGCFWSQYGNHVSNILGSFTVLSPSSDPAVSTALEI